MPQTTISLGIDVGSVSVKLVTIKSNEIVKAEYCRFQGKPLETLHDLLNEKFNELNGQQVRLGLTGIGGRTVLSVLGGTFFNEIAAVAEGNFKTVPDVKTIIEMGGEDSKLIILDRQKNIVSDFAMNAQCAAGTGSFLDQQAGRLKISIENEFGQLALKSKNPPRIAGRCSVFAKSDMIHLQQIAAPDYDIVAGLCFAVARNFKSSIARGKSFDKPIAFEGGVAANPGMIRAFTEILNLKENELIIPPNHNVIGAIGAAYLAEKNEPVELDFEKILSYLKYKKVTESSRDALSFDYPDNKYYDVTNTKPPLNYDKDELFLGVDIGSLSTNLVLIDKEHNVIARRYLMTEGRPIDAVRKGLQEIEEEVGTDITIKAVGTTGSGRYLIGDLIGSDVVRNEITAQATAAINIDSKVDTIFEIGGQDSKYISIDNKSVIDFEMNKACAAGTGSFLQEQAEKLNINIESEFADSALKAKCPVGCGERCTVFMESDLVAHQRSGAEKEDLLAGLAYSIVSNYLTKVVGDRKIGDNIFFQGGVAWNKAVVAAFEQLTGKKITVPPHHDVTGAIGAAILAIEKLDEQNFQSSFKGFDFYKKRYDLESFPCEDCSNQCEIHQVNIDGEEPLYYGSRCEKYDVDKKSTENLPPDFAILRQKYLYKRYIEIPADNNNKHQKTIGIPRVLHFYEYYPFWKAFFEASGFKIISSDQSNHEIVENALELFTAETCYPIKIVYGHIDNLVKKQPDFIFLPSLIKVIDEDDKEIDGNFICPYVQTIGSAVKTKFDFEKEGIKLVDSAIHLSDDIVGLRKTLKPLISDLHISQKQFKQSVDAGLKAYQKFKKALWAEGDKVLNNLKDDDKLFVIVSRPYNGYDRKLSLELPDKIRALGITGIPLDFLKLENGKNAFPYMYWKYGRSILKAADHIRNHPNLFAVYITSFGCGPDSFITHFFRKTMHGKPYLQLELDEHSADAGLVTRIEAFADSLRFYNYKPALSKFNITNDRFKPFEKTIFIPSMSDHAYALRASFERYGLKAEVLDESDELTLDYGKKLTSGKECYPCVLTTGDMIKKIKSPGFDFKKSVFFMPGAGGPCRFGLYSQFHRVVLEDLGYGDIPVFSPNSNDGYSDFGLDGTDFRKVTWKGIVFVDCLIKIRNKIKPYEKEIGKTEKIYLKSLQLLNDAIINDRKFEDLAAEVSKEFLNIPVNEGQYPIVGLVGEIYLRNNRFSNNHLIDKLEKLGLEVWLATFAEWPLYTSHTFLRDSIKDYNFKGALKSSLQILFQQRYEKNIINSFDSRFNLEHEYSVYKVMKLASDYLSLDYKGEAILSIGKSIEMVNNGAGGIVNAMPFNCMPGMIVSSLSKKVSDDLGAAPWLNISYEGMRDSGEETRLEAFADQVKAFSKSQSLQSFSV